ncbi:hypothetical protein V2J09_015399 [Rumex salicifolius]
MDYQLLLFLILLSLPITTFSQLCQKFCGTIPLKYPFGSGSGCGDHRFQKYISCNQGQLTFATHTGCYPITSIDYSNDVLYITDPTMSTCFTTEPSKGFGLDWDAPFTFHDSSVFALLGCSSAGPTPGGNNCSTGGDSLRCDNDNTPLCSSLFSCQPISQLNVPISRCCVYTPVDLGPTFEMDLQKLHCSAYTAVYSFSDQEDNPESWKYGVAIKYKFNVNNDFPAQCAACQSTNGVCGYSGSANSFICNCGTGINTTNDCWFQPQWGLGTELLPWNKGNWFNYYLLLVLGKVEMLKLSGFWWIATE